MASTLASLLRGQEGAELAAQTRAAIQDRPTLILDIATAIAGEYGAWPPESVTRACREEIALIDDADPADIVCGLQACLVLRDVDEALEWLHRIGLIDHLFPELADCVALAQEAGRSHKDVWEHTKLVVKQAVPRPAVRWAALFHDIGKAPTRTFTRHGVHFHGHAEVGARMFDGIARRLPFARELRREIRFLVKHHLRSNQYSAAWTDNAVRRFARDMDAYLTDLLALSRADITSKRPGRRQALLRQISSLQDRVERLRAEDAVVPPLHKGIGNAIMTRFELPPSRLVGDLKRALETAIESGQLEPHREDDYYLAYLADSGLVPTSPRARGDGAVVP